MVSNVRELHNFRGLDLSSGKKHGFEYTRTAQIFEDLKHL